MGSKAVDPRRRADWIKNATGLSDSKHLQRPSDASGSAKLEKVVPYQRFRHGRKVK
ncbi:hypothetical protein NKI56_28460 [Mesorhizobium sp. M0622]|uniref:hypothetical protein n=1 Tax=unclassified Mesorhizobium TaxID=325217 RepID=UPI003338612B